MNPEREIELLERLLDELIVALEAIVSSGEVLSDEIQGLLAEEIAATMQRIDQLRGQSAGIQPTAQQPQPSGTHASSQINATRYNPKTKELMVKFQDKYPGQNGPVYSYQGVEPGTYSRFSAGDAYPTTTGKNKWHSWFKDQKPSLGAAMNQIIKAGNYPYQKIA